MFVCIILKIMFAQKRIYDKTNKEVDRKKSTFCRNFRHFKEVPPPSHSELNFIESLAS